MPDPATPAVEEPKAPATPATPAAPAQGSETVTLTKEEHAQLARDAARSRSAQREKAYSDRQHGRSGRHFNGSTPATPPAPPSAEEQEEIGKEEDRKAERGILQIAVDPKYRAILDADPTLRELLTNNPLGALPIFAKDAFDAEDALGLVREELDKRLASIQKPATPAPVTTPAPNPAPTSVAPNANDKTIDEEYENAKKLPGTEQAVAGMIKANLKKFGRKSA